MSLQSDVTLHYEKLSPSSVSPTTAQFNQGLQEILRKGPQWYEVGAAEYRALRNNGETAFPKPVSLPHARPCSIPSRDLGRGIPCRVIAPRKSTARGTFMHIHGGGWVLNDENSSDLYLQSIAETCGLVCISVGYRLAPEHPFPAAPNDCYDVAEWLVDHAQDVFGARLAFVGGESAGGNLALLVVLHLLKSPNPKYSKFKFKGVLSHFGSHSLHWLASTKNFKLDPPLVLNEGHLNAFRDAYLPGYTAEEICSPDVSPFYADLSSLNLPPAFFSCGTLDCLLEDSIFMSMRWMMAGAEAIMKMYPGSPHGFILFSPETHENAALALADLKVFVDSKMARTSHVISPQLKSREVGRTNGPAVTISNI